MARGVEVLPVAECAVSLAEIASDPPKYRRRTKTRGDKSFRLLHFQTTGARLKLFVTGQLDADVVNTNRQSRPAFVYLPIRDNSPSIFYTVV